MEDVVVSRETERELAETRAQFGRMEADLRPPSLAGRRDTYEDLGLRIHMDFIPWLEQVRAEQHHKTYTWSAC